MQWTTSRSTAGRTETWRRNGAINFEIAGSFLATRLLIHCVFVFMSKLNINYKIKIKFCNFMAKWKCPPLLIHIDNLCLWIFFTIFVYRISTKYHLFVLKKINHLIPYRGSASLWAITSLYFQKPNSLAKCGISHCCLMKLKGTCISWDSRVNSWSKTVKRKSRMNLLD